MAEIPQENRCCSVFALTQLKEYVESPIYTA